MSNTPAVSPDPIVELVRERLLSRSVFGLNKYGVNIQDARHTHREWLQHAQDEALDFANYLEKLKAICDAGENLGALVKVYDDAFAAGYQAGRMSVLRDAERPAT